jgi:hypothetical protein
VSHPLSAAGHGSAWRVALAAIVASSLLVVPASSSQDVSESALKAAFLYNFARFTEWPADSALPGEPLVACVAGDPSVADAFSRIVKERGVGGRRVTLARIATTEPLQDCRLLYLGGVTPEQIFRTVRTLGDAAVLTVADVDAPDRTGAVVRLFTDRGKMRFELDLAAARRVRLTLSSKFLALASKVHDRPQAVAP